MKKRDKSPMQSDFRKTDTKSAPDGKESFRKNDVTLLRIEDMSQEGAGIGKAQGYTVFVKDTVIGDLAEVKIVKTKKNYGFGRLLRILEPSQDRVEPVCPSARQCGGCQLQMLSYPKQLKFKEDKVRNDLIRIGGFPDPPMQAILGMEYPYRYRNKAQFPIGYDKNGRLTAGFYAGRTHTIIPCQDCVLGVEENQQILVEILAWMEENHIQAYREETGKGLLRHVLIRKGFATGELMVCLVINSHRFPEKEGRQLIGRLSRIPGMTSVTYSSNTKKTNVILGDTAETLWGKAYIKDRIGDICYEISPLSFYQVNPLQTRVLYEKALEYAGLTGHETVWDLYCGIGTISLFLAQKAREVYGIEIVPQAVEDARRNAGRNGIENAHFYVGKAEEVLPEKCRQDQLHADVIVVDPPRKGCEESLLDAMIQMQPERIVYVSCDPATLARDLKYLCAGGYSLEKVQPVDQFPQGVHVETVVQLVRKKPDTVLDVKIDLSELDVTPAETEATYQEIKDYILEQHGVKVSSLYIAQVKEKHGLRERENYNKAKSKDTKQLQCPAEKEKLIEEALKHFKMID